MICPNCRTKLNGKFPDCPSCGLNLKSLHKLSELPDLFFNRALEAYKNEAWYTAIENLSVATALNPRDIEAYTLLGNVYIKLKQFEKAKEHFLYILRLDAKNTVAQTAVKWLRENGCKFTLTELSFGRTKKADKG